MNMHLEIGYAVSVLTQLVKYAQLHFDPLHHSRRYTKSGDIPNSGLLCVPHGRSTYPARRSS